MQICIFGYYNKGNAGDDRLQGCFVHLLHDHDLMFLPHMRSPPLDLLRQADLAIIGGGGLIFDHSGIWCNANEWLKASGVPVAIVGVGVNRIEGKLREEVKTILTACRFAMVRDSESATLLQGIGNVEVGVDLSWTMPYEKRRNGGLGKGLAINLLHCPWKEYDPRAWASSVLRAGESVLPFPFRCVGRNSDVEVLAESLPGIPVSSDFTLRPLEECEVALVCRFHAAIFALQMGVPFLAIAYDFKVARLMREAALQDLLLETQDHRCVEERLQYVRDNRVDILARMEAYTLKQRSSGQAWKTELESRVAAIGSRPRRGIRQLVGRMLASVKGGRGR